MDALTALPGVGRKTANVVLGHALGVPGLPVDRHVLRVANRIGIAEGDDPEVVEQQLCGALPEERWTRTSDTLILHGRRICKPKPLCAQCAVQDACCYFQTGRRGGDRRPAPAKPCASRGQRAGAGDRSLRAAGDDARRRSSASSPRRSPPSRGGSATRWRNIAIVVEDEPSASCSRDGDRAARHPVRPLPGHAADRAPLGLRQRAARSHPALPGSARARGRRRGRPDRRRSARRSFTRSATTSA